MTNFVKSLDCPNYHSINSEILQWVEKQNLSGDDFWNPAPVKELLAECKQFREWMVEKQVLISTVAITYGKDSACCGPHIDTKPARFKLSWPIKNAIGTWNRWFQVKNNSQGIVNSLSGVSYNYDDLVMIHQHQLTGPCLIDAGTIHDVWCDNDAKFPRIGLQCQLFKEPYQL